MDLDHVSRIDQLEAAFGALSMRLEANSWKAAYCLFLFLT